MAATAIMAPLQASTGLHHLDLDLDLDLDLHSVTMASKMQTTMEWESEADAIRAAREVDYEESEAEHEQLSAAANHHEQLTARRMLTAMFPSMDIEVIATVLAWNGGDVELAASSILDMWSDGESTTMTARLRTTERSRGSCSGALRRRWPPASSSCRATSSNATSCSCTLTSSSCRARTNSSCRATSRRRRLCRSIIG